VAAMVLVVAVVRQDQEQVDSQVAAAVWVKLG
jgi:hypothetical protein